VAVAVQTVEEALEVLEVVLQEGHMAQFLLGQLIQVAAVVVG
jgi:hypothetical protein